MAINAGQIEKGVHNTALDGDNEKQNQCFESWTCPHKPQCGSLDRGKSLRGEGPTFNFSHGLVKTLQLPHNFSQVS